MKNNNKTSNEDKITKEQLYRDVVQLNQFSTVPDRIKFSINREASDEEQHKQTLNFSNEHIRLCRLRNAQYETVKRFIILFIMQELECSCEIAEWIFIFIRFHEKNFLQPEDFLNIINDYIDSFRELFQIMFTTDKQKGMI